MKNKLNIYKKKLWALVVIQLLFSTGCNIDETAPIIEGDIDAWFSISENNINTVINWNHSEDADLDKYIVYRSEGNNSPQIIGETVNNYYSDSNIEWLKYYNYYIQTEDDLGNQSELSDSVRVRIYSASGRWTIPDYDSSFLCVNHNLILNTSTGEVKQKGFHLESEFVLILNNNLDDSTNSSSVGDTIFSQILFQPTGEIDSTDWNHSGWVTNEYVILDTTVNGDTVNITKNDAEAFYTMNMSDPDNGEIYFSPELFPKIRLEHSLKFCNGNKLFN